MDAPDWVEGKDLTVKAAPGVEGKTKPAASFFALFKKGVCRVWEGKDSGVKG